MQLEVIPVCTGDGSTVVVDSMGKEVPFQIQ